MNLNDIFRHDLQKGRKYFCRDCQNYLRNEKYPNESSGPPGICQASIVYMTRRSEDVCFIPDYYSPWGTVKKQQWTDGTLDKLNDWIERNRGVLMVKPTC